jgi:hypothetical protein
MLATSIQGSFQNTWLAIYTQPQSIVFDNGSSGKFKREFKQIFDNHGIRSKRNKSHNLQFTNYNTQANAIIERVQKVNSRQLHAQII